MTSDDEYFEDTEDLEDTEEPPAYNPGGFRWVDFSIIGVQVAEEIGVALVGGLSFLKALLVGHANYHNNREALTAEAGRELERILRSTGSSDG